MPDPLTIAGIAGGIGASLFNPISQLITGKWNVEQQEKALAYQKEIDEKNLALQYKGMEMTQSNFENAGQIRARDYAKAGLNPLVMQGVTNQEISPSSVNSNAQAPQMSAPQIGTEIFDAMVKAGTSRDTNKTTRDVASGTNSSNEKINAENNKTAKEIARIQSDTAKSVAETQSKTQTEASQLQNETQFLIASIQDDTRRYISEKEIDMQNKGLDITAEDIASKINERVYRLTYEQIRLAHGNAIDELKLHQDEKRFVLDVIDRDRILKYNYDQLKATMKNAQEARDQQEREFWVNQTNVFFDRFTKLVSSALMAGAVMSKH